MNHHRFLRQLASLALVTLLAAACSSSPPESNGSAEPTKPPDLPSQLDSTTQPGATVAPTTASSVGTGDIVLSLRAQAGAPQADQPQQEEATVLVFAQGRLIDSSPTTNGFYSATVPAGAYDIAVLYSSTPTVAYMQKDIVVEGGKPTAVVFDRPSEGELRVMVRTRSGSIPRNPYDIAITSGARQIQSGTGSSDTSGTATFQLSADLLYEVTVTYGGQDWQQTNIRLTQGQTIDARFDLPFDEGDLAVLLRTKSGHPPQKPYGVVISYDAETVHSNPSVEDSVKVALRDDRGYHVAVYYEDQQLQETNGIVKQEPNVLVKADALTEQRFELPWDEGALTVVLRAGDNPLPDAATVTVSDATGTVVKQERFVYDRFTAVLHADQEYTVRVQYKDWPEQQKPVRLGANQSIEEVFTFPL
jgi:hypothetical protein